MQELREIASTLLGTVDIIPEPEQMPDALRAMIESAVHKATRAVMLEVWTPQGALVSHLSQVAPSIEDLSEQRFPVDDLTGAYPTGRMGN